MEVVEPPPLEEGRSRVEAGERPLEAGRSRVEAGERAARRRVPEGDRSSDKRGIIDARGRFERGSGSPENRKNVESEKER